MPKKRRKQQPSLVRVIVSYDGELPTLIGHPYETWKLAAPATFADLFMNLEAKYPALTASYPPGTLGIALNGRPVDKPFQPLVDGDVVGFVAPMTRPTLPA